MIRRRPVLLSAIGLLVPLLVLVGDPAKAATRSVSFSLTPSTSVSGGLVTMTGKVSPARSGVAVVLQHKKGSTWVSDRKVHTTSTGAYSVSARPTTVATIAFRVVAPTQSWGPRTASASRSVKVLAPGTVSIEAPTAVRSDEQLAVTGTVSDGLSGSSVRLERQAGNTWTTVATSSTIASGRYRLMAAPAAGAYRVVAPQRGSRATATSSTADVTLFQVRTAGGTLTGSTTWTTSSRDEVDLTDDLVVPAGVTLRIGEGVRIVTAGHDIVVKGRLLAGQDGTTTFQSTLGSASPALWQGIEVVGGGTADLGSSLVRDATIALDVDAQSSAVWHGTVRSSVVGVNADGFVDARETDWGSSSGPSPYGSGIAVQGQEAQVVPWAGYTVSAPPAAASQPEAVCRDVVVLSARGSKEGPQGDGTYESDPYGGMGAVGYFAGVGALQTIIAQRPSTTYDLRAIRYPASLYPGFTTGVAWPEYASSLMQGALGLTSTIRSLRSACPGSKVVVIGASQGAGVVRLGLLGLTSTERSTVLAVGFVGDPLRTTAGTELLWQSADTSAGSTVRQRSGLLRAGQLSPGAADTLPSDIVGRTLSICRPDDLVCAAGPGATVAGHVAYTSDDVTAIARWLGQKALEGLG